jgi:hypothetical protein
MWGDSHLSSKNRAHHIDYASESLLYLRMVTKIAQNCSADVIIGLGDLSYGMFDNLEYRAEVERLLDKQNKLTNGRRYELIGNHDIRADGMSELQFYIKRGLVKPVESIADGCINLSVLNWGELGKRELLLIDENRLNILIMHDYMCFKSNPLGKFGKGIIIEEHPELYGLDWIIGGHIHDCLSAQGNTKLETGETFPCNLSYPGCMTRTSYFKSKEVQQEKAYVVLLDTDAATLDEAIEFIEVRLLAEDEVFKMGEIQAEKAKQERKELSQALTETELARLSGAVGDLIGGYGGGIRGAADIITHLPHISEKVRKRALSYLSA